MGIFKTLKKLGLQLSSGSNVDHQMRDEAAPSHLQYGPLPGSFFSAVNSAREADGFGPLPVHPRRPMQRDGNFRKPHPRPEFGAFDQNRSASHERHLDRAARNGSPDQFRRLPPGTPIKFRRRPVSPELLQPSASFPSFFEQHSRPASPDMIRHFQHAQQAPHLLRQQQHQQQQQQLLLQQQQQQQQQQRQFDRMMPPAAQFYPQFQQPLYPMMHPNVNTQGWFTMPQQQQQQQQMYPFF